MLFTFSVAPVDEPVPDSAASGVLVDSLDTCDEIVLDWSLDEVFAEVPAVDEQADNSMQTANRKGSSARLAFFTLYIPPQ